MTHLLPVQNQFDSIDLTDNNVMILEGFAKLPRLKSLYLSNNRIVRIGRNLEGCHSPTQRQRGTDVSEDLRTNTKLWICRVYSRADHPHPHKQSLEKSAGEFSLPSDTHSITADETALGS